MVFAAFQKSPETTDELVERIGTRYPPFRDFANWLDTRATSQEKTQIVKAAADFIFISKGDPKELEQFIAFYKKIEQYDLLKSPLLDVPLQCVGQYGKNGMAVLDAFSAALDNRTLFRNKDINPSLVTSIGDLLVASMDAAGPYKDNAKKTVYKYLGNETLSLQDLGPSLTKRFSSVVRSVAESNVPVDSIELAFTLFGCVCSNRTLVPGLLNRKYGEQIVAVSRMLSNEKEPFKDPTIELTISVIKNIQFDVEFLDARTVKNLNAAVNSFALAAHHPDVIPSFPARVFDNSGKDLNFSPLPLEFLTPEWARKVGEIACYAYEKDSTRAISYLQSIMRNRAFSPSMLTRDFAKRLVSLKTDDEILDGEINLVLENKPLLAGGFWDPQLVKRLTAVSKALHALFESDTRPDAHERLARVEGCLKSLLRNSSWSMDQYSSDLPLKVYHASNVLSRRGISVDQLSTFFSEGSPDVIKFIFSIDDESFEKGVAAARAFGMDVSDRVLCLNLAYAISSIGLVKTRFLHERFGVDYFARYSKHTLEEAVRNVDPLYPSRKPVFLVATTKEDHGRGAFYRDHELIDSLTKYYRVVLVEMHGKKETYERIRQVGTAYGPIPNTMLGAHGATWALFVGKWPGEDATIDVGDAKELESLRGFFGPKPYFLFNACLTGKNGEGIAATFSKVFDATVDASIAVSARPLLELDDEGRLIRAKANEIPLFNNEFVSGKVLDSIPRRVR